MVWGTPSLSLCAQPIAGLTHCCAALFCVVMCCDVLWCAVVWCAEEDPREALLRYADAAKANPMFTGAAYAHTQPKTILDFEGQNEEAKKHLSAKQIDTSNKRMA